ncbi:MAG: hypothetical protein ACYS8Y_09495, partial [Planctomycetota bacterium]
HSESIQNELDKSKGEIQHLQNELAKSTAALQTLRSQLNLARINLETSQQQNATAVNQLKEQIQNFTDRIAELNKSRGATSGPLHQATEPTPESLLPLIQFQMQQK